MCMDAMLGVAEGEQHGGNVREQAVLYEQVATDYALLRRGRHTVDKLAWALDLTDNAVALVR